MGVSTNIIFQESAELNFVNLFDEIEFVCNQPSFIAGLSEGERYVLIDATDLPDGLPIYMNTGEFGFVKSERCLIKLDVPLKAGSDVFCYVSTSTCNVESCTYSVGSVLSGNFICADISDTGIADTFTGALVCGVDSNLYREKWDNYGNKVLGTLVQSDCIFCGGTLPNCL